VPIVPFKAGTGPTNKDGSETMHSHLDFELSRARAVEMRREVEHNRLRSRRADAQRSSRGDALFPEELSPQRKGIAARGTALVTALFR
jgi:hypothetical protein